MSFPKCCSTMEHQHQSLLHWRSSRIKLSNFDNISISLLHYFWGQNPSGSKRTRGVDHDRTQWGFNKVHHKRLLEKLSFSGTIEISDCLKGEKQELIHFPSRKDITSVLSYNKLPLAPRCSLGGTKLMPENCISLVTR